MRSQCGADLEPQSGPDHPQMPACGDPNRITLVTLTDEGTGHDKIDTKSPRHGMSGRPFRATDWYDEVVSGPDGRSSTMHKSR